MASGLKTTVRVAPQKSARPHHGVEKWLMDGQPEEPEGPHAPEQTVHRHPWWQVMCLTGVDYFSSIGYQPGIAALAAGALAPGATAILVIMTLFGALPMYRRVAAASPHGDGSISMLERLLSWWQGKILVLVLISFVLTAFVVTITMSASDATAHLAENPFAQPVVGHEVATTLFLILLLGIVFLKGFSEAIGVAVTLVGVYLALNFIVIGRGILEIAQHPDLLANWRASLTLEYGSPTAMVLTSIFLFPRLALGLSGFETGVLVMPLIKGELGDNPRFPAGRIRNTGILLTVAASIMSVLLMTSSFATSLLIPHEKFLEGGEANGRALAYLAHQYLGSIFGTIYDISTILILWFAGASAMAGLLNIVPRYLPRYGMAPAWARATRPLVIVYTLICFAVTIMFRADIDAQAGPYATGVLAVITSASIAVFLAMHRKRRRRETIWFGAVMVIFIYALLNTIVHDPSGLKMAAAFFVMIVVISLVSRVMRSTELRTTEVEIDATAERFIQEAAHRGTLRLIANHPDERNSREYLLKEREEREASHIPPGDPVLFLEVTVKDASEFVSKVRVRGEEIAGFRVLAVESASVPNGLAAALLAIRDRTGKRPHAYFGWTEGNPLKYLTRFVIFGEGDIAPVTREILRQTDPNPATRPAIHVG
ncbi:MAG: APC family permease [Thermomicrobiales bacterium]|nr:APC family permease [Thermomicrobiales bacterium]